MHRNICWKGVKHLTVERCQLWDRGGFIDVVSAISGRVGGALFNVDYALRMNACWEIESAVVQLFSEGADWEVHLTRGERGWMLGETYDSRFDACADIDISLTPLTNTLPIRRMKLGDGQCCGIEVLYIDLLERRIVPMRQSYTCLGRGRFEYRNGDGGYRAELLTDGDGLIMSYPGLFTMDHMGRIE